jgi:glycosyltransferase involved in cell wall biosynthesis
VLEHAARRLKHAYLAELATSRAIERSLARVRFGDPDAATVTASAAVAAVDPDVSVVIPLHDQGEYLREAVESVVAAATPTSPVVEVVVVDDHSTDDSLDVATALVDEMGWFPITVVARAANGGLPVARNTGFAAARGRYVLALDADNLVYPNAIRVLTAHLATAPDDVIAAYGLLERFDERGAIGLTSHLPWDVDLLVHGAYIDAMALVRRAAWAELGGYASDPAIHGWEDYDLWLAAAERGWRADLVGSIVGRYREQPGSMRKISDIDMQTNLVTLRERHPRLSWPS